MADILSMMATGKQQGSASPSNSKKKPTTTTTTMTTSSAGGGNKRVSLRPSHDPSSPPSDGGTTSSSIQQGAGPHVKINPSPPEVITVPAPQGGGSDDDDDPNGDQGDTERRISIFLGEVQPDVNKGEEHFVGLYRYTKVRQLGAGAYGVAWLCDRRAVTEGGADQTQVVAKCLNFPSIGHKAAKFAINEIKCLKDLAHPNVVRFIDSLEAEQSVVIVMEFADGGDLRERVKRHSEAKKPFEETTVLHIFLQIAMGLEYMHSKQTLHRDLKSANVLLNLGNGLVKLADFGFSRHYEQTVSAAVAGTMCGTPYYFAPELWRNERYSHKADIWALGVILYELLTFQRPFKANRGLRELMKDTLNAEYDPIPDHYSPEIAGVLAQLLNKNPEKRPSARELFTQPFLRTTLEQQMKRLSQIDDAGAKLWIESGTALLAAVPSGVKRLNSVMPSVQPIRKGCIRKLVSRSWTERFLEVTDSALLLSKDATTDGPPRKLPLKEVSSVCAISEESSNCPHVFAIHTSNSRCTWMQAQTAAERQGWISGIQQAMGILV